MNERKNVSVEGIELAQFTVNNTRSKICFAGESFGLEEKVVYIYTTIGCHNPEEGEGGLEVCTCVGRHVDCGWVDARAGGELCSTRQAMYVQSKFESRSCNHCCHAKERMSHTLSAVCINVLVIRHAIRIF
jgi:hypothetical protein